MIRTLLQAGAISLLALGASAEDQPANTADKSGYTVFDPTPTALLRAFSPDRPSKANSAYTVDAGHFQYETDLAVYSYSHSDGARTLSWIAPDPVFKIGLTNTIEADLQITPYETQETTVGGRTIRTSGLGDTYARLRFSLLGDDGGAVAASIFPYVKLPTARGSLGDGRVEGGASVPVAITAPHGFTITVMPEVDVLKNSAGGGMHPAFDFVINVGHNLTSKLQVSTEIFTTYSFQRGDRTVYTVDENFAYALTPNLQLDFGANFALNSVQPQLQLFGGVSQRF